MIGEDARPVLSAEEREAFYRRRRARNLGMLAVLVVLVAIFYAISAIRVVQG